MQNMNRLTISTSLFLLASLVFADVPVWPLEVHPSLSSNFGEFRGDHFHMGIDIRTGGTEGHPVFAVSDGHISRMVSNFSGYGKALYLTTTDSLTVVYAHLSFFTPLLENILDVHQGKNKSYFVNQYFTPEMVPVKKGEVIGHSGNTGSSFGPHLHFEIRNQQEQPLNPLTNGFPIPDRIPPTLKEVAIIPLESGAHINASPLPQVFPLFRDRAGFFHFPDTINCDGVFGFAVKAVDKIQNSKNSYQFYKTELIIDDRKKFEITYDHLDFSESGLASVVRDYRLSRLNLGEFQKLFRMKHHPPATINTSGGDGDGYIYLSPGYHTVEIRVEDTAGNTSVATGIIFSHPSSVITAELIREDDNTQTFFISPAKGFIPVQSVVCYSFTAYGFADKQVRPIETKRNDNGLVLTFRKKDTTRKTLQFIGTNKMGAVSYPFHWASREKHGDILTAKIDIEFSHTDAGIFLQVDTETPLDCRLNVRLQKDERYETIPLTKIHPATFLSDALLPKKFEGVYQIDIVLQNDTERIIRYEMVPKLAIPEKTVPVLSRDKNCSIRIRKGSVYHPTLMWIDKVENSAPVPDGIHCSDVYQLQPFEMPLKESIQVGIRYGDEYALDKGLGIYAYNPDTEKWSYLPTENTLAKRVLIAELKEINAVTILQDIQPPVVVRTFPEQGGHYDYEDVEVLSATVKDDLSGIAPNEQSLTMALDGDKLLMVYQPIKKEMSYQLKEPLSAGSHELIIFISDRAGNYTEKTVNFSVD